MNARQKGQKLMVALAAKNHLGLTDGAATKVIGGAGPSRAEADKALAEFKATKDKAAKAKATKNGAKGAKQPKACECGCGGQTKGGRFLIGHDAKLKSRLINAVLDGKNKAAEAQITKLGWSSFLEKSRGSRDRKQAAKAAATAKSAA